MPLRGTRRKCYSVWDAAPALKCRRAGLRSSTKADRPPNHQVDLPHHIMLEVLSFLNTRSIVRARGLTRIFVRDVPKLIHTFEFSTGQRIPAATHMRLFAHVTDVRLDGDNDLLQDAADGLPGCASLRRLRISRCLPVLQQVPLSDGATAKLCGLPLSDFEAVRVLFAIPRGLAMPAWDTLNRLVLRDALICDESLANLFASLPERQLPLRNLDLSRNLFGQISGMKPMARALMSFPELETLEVTTDRISSEGAKHVLGALLGGSCPKLSFLEMSLNFLDDSVMDFLSHGLARETHGLRSLEKLGIGGRFSRQRGVTTLDSLSQSLAGGVLPRLSFLHVQGDVGPAQVGPLLRGFKNGACPRLSVVKVERSTRYFPTENSRMIENAVESMWELVTCETVPRLSQVHVLGMNLGKGLEWAQEERTPFYRAKNRSSFHRLALAGAHKGIMIFV